MESETWDFGGVAVATKRIQTKCPLYCVLQQEAPDRWVKEMSFKTEFKAYISARTRSKAKMCTYMVVNDTTNEVTSIVRHGKGLVG